MNSWWTKQIVSLRQDELLMVTKHTKFEADTLLLNHIEKKIFISYISTSLEMFWNPLDHTNVQKEFVTKVKPKKVRTCILPNQKAIL